MGFTTQPKEVNKNRNHNGFPCCFNGWRWESFSNLPMPHQMPCKQDGVHHLDLSDNSLECFNLDTILVKRSSEPQAFSMFCGGSP